MPVVPKRIASLFSSPSSSPRVGPTDPNTAVPPLSTELGGVKRGGSACSFQLFDLYKALARGNGSSDLAEADSDEDEETSLPLERTQSAATVIPKDQPDMQHWIDETRMQMEREREALSSRFTALSLSNLAQGDAHNRGHKHRPELPKFDADPSPEVDESSASASLSESSASTRISTPDISNRAAVGVDEITDEEKLAAIVDEFGDIAGLMEGDDGVTEPERILAESKGCLFKGIMLIGNLHLTTHRLLFHAFLPPDSVMSAPSAMSAEMKAEAASAAASHQSDVIQSGPVTIHRPGPLKQNKRVWMELSAEMVTTYPSADDAGRVRPLRSVLLSTIRRTEPLDRDHPCDFCFTYETPDGPRQSRFTVDTEQSAMQWRRAFDSAIFRHFKARWRSAPGHGEDKWSMMRCCIPLDRVAIKGITDYHSFATLIGLDIELEGERAGSFQPRDSIIASGDWSANEGNNGLGKKLPTVHRASSTSSSHRPTPPASPSLLHRDFTHWMDSTLPPRLARQAGLEHPNVPGYEPGSEWRNQYHFNIAVLNEQAWFGEALTAAVGATARRRYKSGVKAPKMGMEVAGFDCLATDEEIDRDASIDEEDDDDHEASHTRKAEKAALAAKMFGLREDEGVWIKRCYVATLFVPARGHIIITPKYICFWRRATVGQDIKYRFLTSDVKGAAIAPSVRARFHGMALQINGHRDLRFEFWSKESRDEVISRINSIIRPMTPSSSVRVASPEPTDNNVHPADILAPPKEAFLTPRPMSDEALTYMPFIANRPWTSLVQLTPRTFTCLTIGSRGDVQPYIALGLRLMKDGHKVIIVTHAEFKTWIEGYGIEHRQAGGDPTALMKLSTEHRMFSPGFFKESLGSFRQWLDDLLVDSWTACLDADVLIESPSAMAGVHIAEALKIPYFRAFTMPWTRTTAYPQAFMVPGFEVGPSFNYSTYVLFDNIMWKATAGQINKWRKNHLGLGSTDMSELSVTKVPFLYNFSSAVVPKPLDWHDDITITGYWTLEDSDTDWSPPPDLEQFIAKAKADARPLVYIGFGSIVVPRPNAMTKSIIKAVQKADVRAIIAKGWSSRGGDPATEGEDIEFPSNCYGVEKIPHGWLFPRVQAALHHGGAGTVGASLRAGVPTLIKPWFGDQYFWATRVTKLEVGLKVPSLRSDDIARALVKATTDPVMIEKAARIGERIRSENGVDNAVQAIRYNIIRAGSDRRKMHWAK